MSKFSCGWNFCKRAAFHVHKTFRDECAMQCYWSYKLYVLVLQTTHPSPIRFVCYTLYNELCKTRVLIGLEECVIRV